MGQINTGCDDAVEQMLVPTSIFCAEPEHCLVSDVPYGLDRRSVLAADRFDVLSWLKPEDSNPIHLPMRQENRVEVHGS